MLRQSGNNTAAIVVIVLLCVFFSPVLAQTDHRSSEEERIDEIQVHAKRVANSTPAGTYATVATVLRFDPSTELQSRGLAEGQTDVTVQGSLFENVGFKAGAVTIIDPQTGHYVADLPIDPALLSKPLVQTGINNAHAGFNSSVATLSYSIPKVQSGGSLGIGAGSDNLSNQSLRFAVEAVGRGRADIALQVSASLSDGDGSVPNGDHKFSRYNLQLQRVTDHGQTDLILAHQDKFYGWPGAYTGFSSLAETDHTKTDLVMVNHHQNTNRGWFEFSAYYRQLDDNYDFDRTTQESGGPGAFDHRTRVSGLGVQGEAATGNVDWNFAVQATSDRLVHSTDLTEGLFDSRNYVSLSLLPSVDVVDSIERRTTLYAGLTFDYSSRDSDALLPILGVEFRHNTDSGTRFLKLEYAGNSQVPGYTALNSRPTGLFGGNASLGRERANQATLTLGRQSTNELASIAVFVRQDDDLVDWTYSSGAPFARQANAVDVSVVGAQAFLRKSWQSIHLAVGYTFLDKDADYGDVLVDASFYALNYARHRATLAVRYQINDRFEVQLDNEYRHQENNPLRGSSAYAHIASASLVWLPRKKRGIGIVLSADNLTDDDYQQFPGTPAVGRQVSLSARYDW